VYLFGYRGVDELLGVTDKVTIINSTFGKALGGAAGGILKGNPHGCSCFCCISLIVFFVCLFLNGCFFLPAGGFTVGPQPLVDLLRQRARPYLFSNALPPPVTACALAALNLVADGTLAQSITEKTRR